MKVRNFFEEASLPGLFVGVMVACLLGAASGARAQTVAPYTLADCEATPGTPSAYPAGTCDSQPQLDYDYDLASVGYNLDSGASSIAISPDGTRLFAAFSFVIEVYQRNPATGLLTYESCIVDGTVGPGTVKPLKLPQPCATVAPQNSLRQAAMFMSVSPAGNILYLTNPDTFTVLSIGTPMAFVACWKSAEKFDGDVSNYGSCQPVYLGSTADRMLFDTIRSPAVSPSGADLYVAVDAARNYGNNPATDARGAVLHFTGNIETGTISYADCAGVVVSRNQTTYTQQALACSGDSGALDLRNIMRAAVTPDGANVFVTGSASDTLGNSDAIARLSVSLNGSLSFGQCLLADGGACQTGQGAVYGATPAELQISNDSRDLYVNSHPPAHLRVTNGTAAAVNDFSGTLSADYLASRRFAFGPGETAVFENYENWRMNVWDRNSTTGALTYRGCVTSDAVYNPDCALTMPVGWNGRYIAVAPQTGGMVTAGGTGVFLASFQSLRYTLTASVTPGGGGTVTSNPAGIDCGATCVATFDAGASVVLSATPAAGFVFSGWTGYCAGLTTCTVPMDQDRSAGATFTQAYTLTVSVSGSGGVATTGGSVGIACPGACSDTYASGTTVSLAATPAAGYAFAGWSGDCFGTGTCGVSMTQDRAVTATFTASSPVPAAPSNFNAVVTATKVAKKTVYTGTLTWTDNASNETAFLIQRYKLVRRSCVVDTKFGTATVGANVTTYTDSTASSAVCGYQIAAANGSNVSAWVVDLNVQQ